MNKDEMIFLEEVAETLAFAKTIIRAHHGIGMKIQDEKLTWDIYNTHAPEMKRINDAIEKCNNVLRKNLVLLKE